LPTRNQAAMIRPGARGAREKSVLNTQAWGENVLVELGLVRGWRRSTSSRRARRAERA
jgi:hypothetical protein